MFPTVIATRWHEKISRSPGGISWSSSFSSCSRPRRSPTPGTLKGFEKRTALPALPVIPSVPFPAPLPPTRRPGASLFTEKRPRENERKFRPRRNAPPRLRGGYLDFRQEVVSKSKYEKILVGRNGYIFMLCPFV